MARLPWYRILYVQVMIGMLLGVAVGWMWPGLGRDLKPLGDGFVSLVKMGIAPIIFCTVVHGIASMGDLRRLGRVGGKTLLYFEVVSTLALILGLVVVNLLKPGVGFETGGHVDGARVAGYVSQAQEQGTVKFLLNIIPHSFVDAFAKGDLLQVLLLAGLSAFALAGMGEKGRVLLSGIERLTEFFFGIIAIVVKVAPVGAFGAMAFTVGSYGIGSLSRLALLMGGFYLTAAVFVFGVLGAIARVAGFSVVRFVLYLREELLLVLGTSSSETALPGMMRKLQALGCKPGTVGLVIPTGYSFNLDGTNIYMAMAAVFLAQATGTPLDLRGQVALLLVAMLSSKGASGVTGAGFIALAATLQAVGTIPVESMALLVGIDRFMSECRALTNLVGNGVATVVISRWEGEVSPAQLRAAMKPALPVLPLVEEQAVEQVGR